ncbi:hypothetical protein EDC04DRAFT_2611825 [Pisolithus marmoratus]|nr:hypothetical protein EDC04DRAFT_2611825 [Pisolithus marmoratus]
MPSKTFWRLALIPQTEDVTLRKPGDEQPLSIEICMLTVSDDDHRGVPIVTDNIETAACGTSSLVIWQCQYSIVTLYIGVGQTCTNNGQLHNIPTVLTVTGNLHSTAVSEYIEESPIKNYSAILKICVLTISNDEHRSTPTVTGDVGTLAHGVSMGGKEPPQYYFLSQSSSQISAKSKHLADHAVLFNKTVDENILGKPHSRWKDINTVIANTIFHHDRQYGESYTAHPAKFVTAVASHLVILKNKFKSTGKGISPNDPNHQNLHHTCSLSLSSCLCSLLAFNLEKVLAEFPFWDECDQLWCGNPAYDARVFNATPGTNQTSDFLSIIKHGRTTSVPASSSSQVQGQDNVTAEDPNYPCPPLDADPVLEHDFFEDKLEQEEEEEGRMDEIGSVGQAVPESSTGPMLVDKQPQIFDNHGTSQHYPSNSTDMILPSDRPIGSAKCQTPSSDNCTTFHMAPYPKPPASITSTSTTSTMTSSGIHHLAMTSKTSQTNVMKGKDTLAQIKAGLDEWLSELNESSKEQCYNTTALKYEHKSMKMQAYMHNKEITHLEIEQQHLEIERLREEGKILQLKLQLAQLQSGQTGDMSASSASTATGLPPSAPPSVN